MRMTVLSLLAGLALCSTATAAVITSNVRAEQPARKPMMIAQAGGPRDPQMDRERQPSCSDISADKQEEMRWLESRLSLLAADRLAPVREHLQLGGMGFRGATPQLARTFP